MVDREIDERYMRLALNEAQRALDEDEVPVGCVITDKSGRLIAKAHNQRETLADPTAHAEVLALTQAADAAGSWRLDDTTLYVTLEPCPMCAGAIVNARVPRVVYGVRDPKAGAVRSLYRLLDDGQLNHRAEIEEGVLGDECREILQAFFQRKREVKK
jgi:tRNA(adenine34) deaminase